MDGADRGGGGATRRFLPKSHKMMKLLAKKGEASEICLEFGDGLGGGGDETDGLSIICLVMRICVSTT